MCRGYGPFWVSFLSTCSCIAGGMVVQILTGSMFLGLAMYLFGPLIIIALTFCWLRHCYDFDSESEADAVSEVESYQNGHITRPDYNVNFSYSSDGDSLHSVNSSFTRQYTRPSQVSLRQEITDHATQDTRNAESNANPPRYEELFP